MRFFALLRVLILYAYATEYRLIFLLLLSFYWLLPFSAGTHFMTFIEGLGFNWCFLIMSAFSKIISFDHQVLDVGQNRQKGFPNFEAWNECRKIVTKIWVQLMSSTAWCRTKYISCILHASNLFLRNLRSKSVEKHHVYYNMVVIGSLIPYAWRSLWLANIILLKGQ